MPGLRPGEIASIIDEREIVLNPAQSDAVRAGARSGGGGGPMTFGDINVFVEGGGAGDDPAATGDQIGLALVARLDELREK